MADVQRPRLEHRASQTIIDLTNDPEELLFLPAGNHRDRSRSQRPPQLGRSDASGIMGLIDLTEDHPEPDIIITGERELSVPREVRHRHIRTVGQPPPIRMDSPGLFVRDAPAAPLPPPQPRIHRMIGGVANAAYQFLGVGRDPPRPHVNQAPRHQHAAFHIHGALDEVVIFEGAGDLNQAMPGHMDYARAAFPQRKPEHVPPKKARENFTRSPKEDMEILCPSCEEELIIHSKEIEAQPAKKSGKAPSRKEREEHSFWVLKECGHTYCNRCFQNRATPGKVDKVFFNEATKPTAKSKGTKPILCSVENCGSDVKNKDKWVGIFS